MVDEEKARAAHEAAHALPAAAPPPGGAEYTTVEEMESQGAMPAEQMAHLSSIAQMVGMMDDPAEEEIMDVAEGGGLGINTDIGGVSTAFVEELDD